MQVHEIRSYKESEALQREIKKKLESLAVLTLFMSDSVLCIR